MSKLYTASSLLTIAVLISGCSQSVNSKNENSSLVTSNQVASDLALKGKTNEASDMYARIGEILVARPQGIFYAQAMLEKSLDLNSNNNKANIYSAIVSPAATTRGFVPRFKEVFKNSPSLSLKLKNLEAGAYNSQIAELIQFATILPEGKDKATSYEEVRKFIRNELALELKNSLLKLDKVKGETYLSLSSNSQKNNQLAMSSSTDRSVESTIDSYLASQSINSGLEKKVKVDEYDLKAMKIILSSHRSALILASSIGLQGFESLEKQVKNKQIKTDKEIVDAIKAQTHFLKIDGNKEDLMEIFSSSEEIMNDLIDFSKISNEICDSEKRSQNAFSQICVTEEVAEKVSEVLSYIVGPKTIVLGYNESNEEVTVEVDVKALLNSKTNSLQELLPTKFNEKGRALEFVDQTFKGIIPNGDLVSKLKTVVRNHVE